MAKTYNTLVFIGRFQPFHNGHKHVIDTALSLAKNVIVLLGSANRPRSTRNPWTWQEREYMIRANYADHEPTQNRLWIHPLADVDYNDEEWISTVDHTVRTILAEHEAEESSIGLIGFSKDRTSYYLDMFPEWGSVSVDPWIVNGNVISATNIRDDLFSELGVQGCYYLETEQLIPEATRQWINRWLNTPIAQAIYEEYKDEALQKAKWAQSPYPVTFVTVDAVVCQTGHVLLVQRKGYPGKGLWALPGGFLNTNESLIDSMIRELREETGIKVPAPVLRGSIKDVRVFDDPKRSTRGRTITHAYKILLKRGPLPRVRGSDDAAKAKWVKLSALKPENMFEDHYWIIKSMV